jgi:mersacidin/lichenicidin family type 2 lantibiotic
MDSIHAGKGLAAHQSLNAAERAALPADPAGALVLTEEDLGTVVGGLGQDSDPCEGGEGKRG